MALDLVLFLLQKQDLLAFIKALIIFFNYGVKAVFNYV
jgi:hypothetical protein